MDAELEKLIEQRKELDRKIKELQSPVYKVDGAEMRMRYGDSWVVTLQEINDSHITRDRTWKYKQILIADTKEDAIKHLETLINTLTALREKITK